MNLLEPYQAPIDGAPADWDLSFDVVVVGSGAAGLTAATVAASLGATVLVLEKCDMFGGSAAVSGGVVWVPANADMLRAGIPDTKERAETYLRSLLGRKARWDQISTYLARAPEMLEFMHKNSALKLVPRPVAPDYYPEIEGAAPGGRMMDPEVYDGRRLGPLFAKLRPPLPSFLLFGGMMVSKKDIDVLLSATRSFKAALKALGLLGRYLLDRLRFSRGTRLVVGNALAGRLLQSAADMDVSLWDSSNVLHLHRSGQRIEGVSIQRHGRHLAIHALRGVVLATGGAPADPAAVGLTIPYPDSHKSMAPGGNTGDGIRLGLAAGGRLDDVNESNAFWTPVSVMTMPDGTVKKFPHLITDRSKPGLIAVNRLGRRFVNEAVSYHDFVSAMHAGGEAHPAVPALLVCDSRFLKKYGLGHVKPWPFSPSKFVRSGYLICADSLKALARQVNLPPEEFRQTVEKYNRDVLTGKDSEFGKGDSAYHRYLGDPANLPNPCLAPIERPPFYAVWIYPGDIGTSRGLRVDDCAHVLDSNDAPIPGLYACGNDMNSIMAGSYPSGGITLGPALTFGYIAARTILEEKGVEVSGGSTGELPNRVSAREGGSVAAAQGGTQG